MNYLYALLSILFFAIASTGLVTYLDVKKSKPYHMFIGMGGLGMMGFFFIMFLREINF